MTGTDSAPQTTALTTAPGNAMATYQEPFETGLEAMDSGDSIIPRLTIVQPNKLDVTPETEGKMHISVLNEHREKMTLVLFGFAKSRCKMPDDFDRNSKPQCKSSNFITPDSDIENPLCDKCGLVPLEPGQNKRDQRHYCEYANFRKNDQGKTIAPKCKESWDMLVLDAETYMPMFWSARSTALAPTKRLTNAIKMIGLAKRIPAWGFKFDVSIKQDPDTSKGRFFIPDISAPSILSQEEFEVMNSIKAALGTVSAQADFSADSNDAPPHAQQQDDEQF